MNILRKLLGLLRRSKSSKITDKISMTQTHKLQTPGYPSGRVASLIRQQKCMLDELSKANDAQKLCNRLLRFKNLNDMDEEQLRSFLGMLVTWFGATLEGRYIVKDHDDLAGMLDDIVSWPEIGKGTKQTLARLQEAFQNTPKELWDNNCDA